MREDDQRRDHAQRQEGGQRMQEGQEEQQQDRQGSLPGIRSLVEQEDGHREDEESDGLLRDRAREEEEAPEQGDEEARDEAGQPTAGRLHSEQIRREDCEGRDQRHDQLDVRKRGQSSECERGRPQERVPGKLLVVTVPIG